MAILPMKKLAIVGTNNELEQVLESIQRMEEIEIDSLYEDDEIEKFDDRKFIEKSETIKRNIKTSGEAQDILKMYSEDVKEPSMLEGRKILDKNSYDDYLNKSYQDDISLAEQIVENHREIREKKANVTQLNLKIESLSPWKNLDIPLNMKSTKHTSIFIGTFPEELTRLDIETKILENLATQQEEFAPSDIPFEVRVLSSIKVATYVVIITLNTYKDQIFEAIRKMGFSYPPIQSDTAVQSEIENIKEDIKFYENDIEVLEKKIKSEAGSIENLRFLQDFETLRSDKFKAISETYKLGKVFMITGYIPEKDYDEFSKKLTSKYNLYIQGESAPKSDETPVKLKNVGYAEPLETTVCGYAPPGAGDVDPTFPVSIFYYFLFGMMFSDAGYGLLMVLVCGLGLLKHKDNIEKTWKNNLKMFFFAGAFTIFWGIMFGSFFGDLIGVVSSTFFSGKVAFAPVWFDPVINPMRLLSYSLIIGLVHLFTGHTIKGYIAIKEKDYKSLFYDVISWYGLLISLLIVLLNSDMLQNIFNFELSVPQGILSMCKYVAILCSIIIIFTSARDIEHPAGRIGMGVYNLYGVTGWLSDVLSYARLLALGLATGVIGTVINMMASMVATGKGVIGALLFIIIVVAGHALNFGINVLGAYVHTNRLQYVEFFGKFYEGGGKLFTPLSMNTKYYKFKEN